MGEFKMKRPKVEALRVVDSLEKLNELADWLDRQGLSSHIERSMPYRRTDGVYSYRQALVITRLTADRPTFRISFGDWIVKGEAYGDFDIMSNEKFREMFKKPKK